MANTTSKRTDGAPRLRIVDEPKTRVQMTLEVSGSAKFLSRMLKPENIKAFKKDLQEDLKGMHDVTLERCDVTNWDIR